MRAIQIFVWDWAASWNFLIRSAVVIAMLIFAAGHWSSPHDARLILVFSSLGLPIVMLEICFDARRMLGELTEMIGRPTPAQLIIGTYAAMLSMSLFLTNLTGWILLDAHFLFNLNAGVLLMTSVVTATAVVSPWHDASILPHLAGLFLAYRLMEHDDFPWVTANPTAASICAVAVIPAVTFGSVLLFERSVRNSILKQEGIDF